MKKIIYAILICLILIGIIITATIGLKVDLIYGNSTRLNIYIGKDFEIEKMREITDEIWKGERVILQKYRTFEDVLSITVKDASDEQIEQLNQKINESLELENKKESIAITKQPNIKLSSLIKPYIAPIGIATIIVVIYMMIKYRKLGILQTIIKTVGLFVLVEAILLSICAITRFPINRMVIPVGICIYVLAVTILSIHFENKLEKIEEAK